MEDDFLKYSEPFCYIFESEGEFYGMRYNGQIYCFDNKTQKLMMNGFPEGNVPMNIHTSSEGTLIAAGDNGLVMEFDFESGIKKSFRLPNESTKGLALYSLKKHPLKDIVVGSQYLNSQIFKINPKTGKNISSLNKICAREGQINCSEIFNDKYYLGSYSGALITEYEPEKDFAYGKNPKVVAQVGEEQNRPVAMAMKDGLIYMITKAEYCILGGAISVFDPKTYRLDVYRNFVKDQNPNSMFLRDSFIVGTTEIYADQKTNPGTADEAVVYVWDINSRKVIHTSTPDNGSERLVGVAISPEGKMLGFCRKGYFLFDILKKSYEYVDIKPTSSRGVFVDNTTFMGATKDKLFLLNIKTNETQYLADFEGAGIFERISENEFLFDQQGELFKLKLS